MTEEHGPCVLPPPEIVSNRRRGSPLQCLAISVLLLAVASAAVNVARVNRVIARDRYAPQAGTAGSFKELMLSEYARSFSNVTSGTGGGSNAVAVGGPGVNGEEESGDDPRLPDVLLIGAQKAGSTSLAYWLFNHGVCRARRFGDEPDHYQKEVHFFNKDARHGRGAGFYGRRFRHCPRMGDNGTSLLAMDATPNYLPHAHRVRSTYDAAGQAKKVKVMVILREPVSRELSLYNHMVYKYRRDRHHGSHLPYFEHVARDDGSVIGFDEYVDRVTPRSINVTDGSCRMDAVNVMACLGLYAHYLRQWIGLFDREQLLVLSYDELRNNEEVLLDRVRAFLGLNRRDRPDAMTAKNTKEGEHKVHYPPCLAQDRLLKVFGPANEALYDLLEENPGPMEQRPFPKFADSNCSSEDAKEGAGTSGYGAQTREGQVTS